MKFTPICVVLLLLFGLSGCLPTVSVDQYYNRTIVVRNSCFMLVSGISSEHDDHWPVVSRAENGNLIIVCGRNDNTH